MQITPESLQNLIANDPEKIEPLFHELRFIVSDEVHVFMTSERGAQLLCCLQRLELLAKCDPRRIVRDIDGVQSVYAFRPYFMDIRGDVTDSDILDAVDAYLADPCPESLVRDEDELRFGKYDKYVPDHLLMKAFARDRLDSDFDLDV